MNEQNETDRNDVLSESDPAERLLAWYQKTKRDLPWRQTKNSYEIWVSEVMLQQTQVKTVIPYYARFLRHFPTLRELGEADFEEVLTEWRGLGYYSRARRLWEGARYLLTERDGKMPDSYQELLKVPGIGKYTAGAVASFAYNQKVPAIDGNVLRVVSRLLAWQEPVESVKTYRYFAEHIAAWQPAEQAGDFNQALMELGATLCSPAKPDCLECPLAEDCLAGRQDEGDVCRYPVKKPKAQRQEITRLTFVLRSGNRIYFQKRSADGMLADLWELPGVEILPGNLPEFSASDWLQLFQEAVADRSFDQSVQAAIGKGLKIEGPEWYNFSHRRWKLMWLEIEVSAAPRLSQEIGQATGPLLSSETVRETEKFYAPGQREEQKTPQTQKEHLPAGRCWLEFGELQNMPIPVAFKGVLNKVMRAGNL